MEIRRPSRPTLRFLLVASFMVILTKVSLVIIEPLSIIAQRFELCECKWLNQDFRHYTSTFLMTDNEASHFDLPQINQLLSMPSTLNTTQINNIKLELLKFSTPSMMVASRHNMRNAKSLTFAHEERYIRKIPADIFEFLAYDTYSEFGRPSKCSIVGNSGILNNSSCGEHIDSADFVIRFNVPLINGFRKDVGSRSDVTTINPSQIQNQFGGLRGYQARRDFLSYMKQYHRYIWVSAFASVSTMEVTRPLLRTIRGKLSPSRLLLGNPQHWRSMTRFWRGRLVSGKRLSSGIYWVSNALAFCDEVHLYGFWPFKSNSVGQPIRYHYYTDKPPTTLPSQSHSFSDEFSAILELHKNGVLQLHADKCD